MQTLKRFLIPEVALIIVVVCFLACNRANRTPELKPEMRDSYAAAYALFRDVWSKERFSDPSNRADIISQIDRLSKNFHGVERKTEQSKYDAGFNLALELNQEFLSDVKRRFIQGQTDYAAWRLRGVMHNCVACHTNYNAPVRFIGEVPKPASDTIESRLEVASFLIATRQFEKASDLLLEIVSDTGAVVSPEQPEFRALKLWLMVQMKTTPKFAVISSRLRELSSLGRFRVEAASIVQKWIEEAEKYGSESEPRNSISDAEYLTANLNDSSTFLTDDQALVSSLYAASVLHNLLPTVKGDSRRKAVYLLGLTYHHIQITELDIFKGLYLEQCIKEFPHTMEARKAFKLFESEIESLSSGSAGLRIDEEDKKKIEDLRSLAS